MASDRRLGNRPAIVPAMNQDRAGMAEIIGESFLDRSGQRWWVKERRAGSIDQLVVEAQLSGSYSRVALYVMTEREFQVHARATDLKPDRPTATRER